MHCGKAALPHEILRRSLEVDRWDPLVQQAHRLLTTRNGHVGTQQSDRAVGQLMTGGRSGRDFDLSQRVTLQKSVFSEVAARLPVLHADISVVGWEQQAAASGNPAARPPLECLLLIDRILQVLINN